MDVITRWIGTRTCCMRNGKLTYMQNSLKSQFLKIIGAISSLLSLSHPQIYHYLRIRSYVIHLYLFMPWSRVNTKYSIHQVQHTPSKSLHWELHTPPTAYAAYFYCMIGLCLLWPEINLVWPELSLVWPEISLVWPGITVSLISWYIDAYAGIHTCTHIYMALWHS